MVKIKDLPNGTIVWKGFSILGVKGMTLSEKYYDNYCIKLQGNILDYEIIEKIESGE